MPAKCHTNPLFLKLQLLLLKFKKIFELQVCKLMHRYRNNFHIGNNTTSDFVSIHSYKTRLLSKIIILFLVLELTWVKCFFC